MAMVFLEAVILDLTVPVCTYITLTPSGATSSRKVSQYAYSAALDAE